MKKINMVINGSSRQFVVGLDATRAPKDFDAGHIALAIGNGEPADFLDLAATLGRFKIDKVTIEK